MKNSKLETRNSKLSSKPWIIGHRGAKAYEPENTIRSFKRAIEMGVDYIECDVRASLDGHIVVIHDSSVNRTTNGKGYVSKISLDTLRKFDAGMGEKIPLLTEILHLIKQKNVGLFLEIKVGGLEKQIVELLVQEQLLDRVFVISFHPSILKKIKQLCPQAKTGFLFFALSKAAKYLAKKNGFDAIMPRFHLVNKRLIKQANKLGMLITTWTINDSETAKKFFELGVNGIASDKPDII